MSHRSIDQQSLSLDIRLASAASRARTLLGSRPSTSPAGATESSRSRSGPPDQADVQAIARQLKRARMETPGGIPGRDPTELDRIAASLVERARAVMNRLESGASAGTIGEGDALALESVIRTRGRPALAIEGERIAAIESDKHPGSDFWRIPLNDHETQLVRVAGVTGAVMVHDTITGGPPEVRGTAWLIRSDLVVTNRHVLFPASRQNRLAKRLTGRSTEAAIKPDLQVMVDFAFDDGPPRMRRCLVTGVLYVSKDDDPVDVALLRIAGAAADASPLSLADNGLASRQLYLFGHPGVLRDVPDEVQAVFGTPNGRKRVCCGELMVAEPARPGELAHDASTIGGFSGGCVLVFGSTDVTALHYYGDPLRGNRAITAGALRAHAVAAFF